ncbi:sensor histidine kinase [Oceanirhabdus sp. W0125-5]|uniref:sensor histidine kinase n=1 Tax=Oceanirhabdus sp. W0125-5 TaxID=2999116 RepID=UPI0022F2B3DF|nr:HAMP domain-containing sensor histidine kinase [Oceanirhabdus sp. W0125-5]WBW94760.1 HAMP domain-containing sensor histidine kinase [Oceanirhabdus sp. W0125-5]
MRKNKMKFWIGIIVILFLFNKVDIANGEESYKKNILIINSYNHDEKWSKDIFNAIKMSFTKDNDVMVRGESLNYQEYLEEEYLDSIIELFNYKYKKLKIDIIVTIGEPAYKFVIKNGQGIFGETPHIVTGINNINLDEINNMNNVIATKYQIDILSNIELIYSLHPELDKLIFIEDVNPLFEWDIDSSIKELGLMESEYKKIKSDDTDFIINEVKKIQGNKAILLSPINTINYDVKKPYNKFSQELSDSLEVPMYTGWGGYTGQGVVGGKLHRSYFEGIEAVKIIKQIFLGEDINNLESVVVSNIINQFDYRLLERFKITIDMLPEGTMVFNQPEKSVEINKDWLLIWMAVLIIAFAALIKYLSFNISKRRIAEKSVEESNEMLSEVKEHNRIKSDFFANITHDIRTPINIILSVTQLAGVLDKKNDENFDKIKKYNGTIRDNCFRLLRISNNLIDMTKIDSGFMNMEFKNHEIISLIENITLSVAKLAENKGIEIIFDTEVEEKIIVCDGLKIERVIMNLLSNAIKFTNENGNIEVYIYEDNSEVVISVKDSGIGMPKDKLNSIFERFDMVEGNQDCNAYGSGIGLFIVKSIVEKHDGNIEVKSKLGEGTEFIIRMPSIVYENQVPIYYSVNNDNESRINIEFSDISA